MTQLAFAGYPADREIVIRLMDMGWRLGHITPNEWEWRKQDENGKWTVKEGGEVWRKDYEAAKRL